MGKKFMQTQTSQEKLLYGKEWLVKVMFIKEQDIFWYYYFISRIKVIEVYVKQGPPVVFEETKYTSKNIHENKF